MKIETVIVSMDEVLDWFAKSFQTSDGSAIKHRGKTYVDVNARTVIFQLYLENGEERRFRSHEKPLSPLKKRRL
jgi:hypothetical protein